MAIGIVGRKVGMTRVFTEEGGSVPVTVIEVEPNRVTQLRTIENDGYEAVQITTGRRKASKVKKPVAGHLAKAGVEALTRTLAAEWAPHGVRVNALAPGYVKTEMAPVDRPEFRRHWIEDAPMQRYAVPDELGPSLVYLASDASSFVTGTVLVVDGGYTLW